MAAIVCLLLCALSVALQVSPDAASPGRKPRVFAGPLSGRAASVRQPERFRSLAALQSGAIIAWESESAPALRVFGAVVAGAFGAKSQFRFAAGLGRAPPRTA